MTLQMKILSLKAVSIVFLLMAVANSQSADFEYGPPSDPYQVNGNYHLVIIQNSETFHQITFDSIFTAESKTLFFGSMNGISITGEILAKGNN